MLNIGKHQVEKAVMTYVSFRLIKLKENAAVPRRHMAACTNSFPLRYGAPPKPS
jgi:hypothetical protein